MRAETWGWKGCLKCGRPIRADLQAAKGAATSVGALFGGRHKRARAYESVRLQGKDPGQPLEKPRSLKTGAAVAGSVLGQAQPQSKRTTQQGRQRSKEKWVAQKKGQASARVCLKNEECTQKSR